MVSVSRDILNRISILSLRCFAAVAETQSFSKAARQLRLSASSVTKHVQLIEESLDIALLHRTTRRVSVTAAGAEFHDTCISLLAQIDEAAASVMSDAGFGGNLRVSAPPSFVSAVLSDRIDTFLDAHPALSVDVLVTSTPPDLVQNRIDVAVVLRQEPRSKQPHELLASCPSTICAAPAYIERAGMPKSVADLANHDTIGGQISDMIAGWELKEDNVWHTAAIRPRLVSDNGELLRHACLRGTGIGVFFEFHVREDIRAGRLVRVLPHCEVRSKNIFLATPHRHIVRPQTKRFLEFIKAAIQEEIGQ